MTILVLQKHHSDLNNHTVTEVYILKFIESTIEETALECLKDMGGQRITFGEMDKRMKSHKGTMTDSCELASLRGGIVRVKRRGAGN